MPARTSPLNKAVKKVAAKRGKREPLWKGPYEDGLTQSMINNIMACRERARIEYIEGVQKEDQFEPVMEYGNMWHLCEEKLGANQDWEEPLLGYTRQLQKRYPLQQAQIIHTMRCCQAQFPVYVKYWAKHRDVLKRTPISQEFIFNIPYKLPSGRTVRLRGKWDGLDRIGNGRNAAIFLQENKTKSDVGDEGIKRKLLFDLQTGMYLVSVREYMSIIGLDVIKKEWGTTVIGGVRYNVVKRPLSGGVGSIRKHQPTKAKPKGESDDEFYERLGQVFVENHEAYFKRWNVDVSPVDLERFEQRFLQPYLENICDWWEYLRACDFDPWGTFQTTQDLNKYHFQHPYGMFNPMDKGYQGDLDDYVATGRMTGLRRVDTLFTELQ